VVATPGPADPDTEFLLGLSSRAAAALAWAGAWITGGLVWWLAPEGARFARHHARHAVWVTGGVTLLALGLWALSILMAFLVTPTAFAAVSWMATGAWVALPPFWAWGLFHAARGRPLHMPGLTARIERPGATPAAEAQPAGPPEAQPE
jgi:uncharacterized membrane protein